MLFTFLLVGQVFTYLLVEQSQVLLFVSFWKIFPGCFQSAIGWIQECRTHGCGVPTVWQWQTSPGCSLYTRHWAQHLLAQLMLVILCSASPSDKGHTMLSPFSLKGMGKDGITKLVVIIQRWVSGSCPKAPWLERSRSTSGTRYESAGPLRGRCQIRKRNSKLRNLLLKRKHQKGNSHWLLNESTIKITNFKGWI